MNKYNRTWIAFANKKRCRHADAINTLGFISWRMGRARFAIGDIVYLFMSDERYVRFKMIVTTYKLELLAESNRSRLTESDLLQHGFKGGKSLENPNCNNMELINYIKSVF